MNALPVLVSPLSGMSIYIHSKPLWRHAMSLLACLGIGLLPFGASRADSSYLTDMYLPLNGAWEFSPQNPIINMGDMREFGFWNDPSVLKVSDGEYVMYVTSTEEQALVTPTLPFRAISGDGLSWTLEPATPLLNIGGTPFAKIETPSVVFFKGLYHMYFTGVYPEGSIPSMEIGHAVSDNGVDWTYANDGNAVLKATGDILDWNGFVVAEPGVVVFNNRLYVYFTAAGARLSGLNPQIKQVIGLAVSSDGFAFGEQQVVLTQSILYPPNDDNVVMPSSKAPVAPTGLVHGSGLDRYRSPSLVFAGYSTPSALEIDGRIHLFFDVARFMSNRTPQWMQVAIHHAVSDDGITFQQDTVAVVDRARDSWTRGEVRSPCALLEGDTVRMWYAGNETLEIVVPAMVENERGADFGIGHASIDLVDLLDYSK